MAHVKSFYVLMNGNKYMPPKKILINTKRTPGWIRVLDEISRSLDNKILVKKLFKAEDGTMISDFDQILNNEYYVASDHKNYIDVGYSTVRRQEKYVNMYSDCALWLKNVQNNLIDVRRDLLVIYVVKNCEFTKITKIVLTKEDLQNWNRSLSYIDKKLDLHGESTKHLYTLNGKIVCGPWELQHGGMYLAVGNSDKYYPRTNHDIHYSKCIWKDGVPFFPKPKIERCYHKRYKQLNSWELTINWKKFNDRYATQIVDCSQCRSKHLCFPRCVCEDDAKCKIKLYRALSTCDKTFLSNYSVNDQENCTCCSYSN